ncbi:MAG: DNA-primase RepB domain-containing protein [Solirubrobacterales bacterium]
MTRGFDYSIPQDDALALCLAPHYGVGASGYCELRFKARSDGQFGRRFVPAHDIPAIAAAIAELQEGSDVYYGILPRREMAGTADACLPSRLAFLDLDSPEAIERAMSFRYPPNFVVETSPGHAQAYWDLAERIEPRFVRAMNLRLAHHLGGDTNACDPARIFRPPNSTNHKYDPVHPVRCVQVVIPEKAPTARELVGDLPAPPQKQATSSQADIRPLDRDDALATIPATVYAPVLTGRDLDAGGYMVCPWHAGGSERTPSLKCWKDASDGWNCFAGCGGGDIYTFAAKLWNLDSRRDFRQIKSYLLEALIAAGRGTAA